MAQDLSDEPDLLSSELDLLSSEEINQKIAQYYLEFSEDEDENYRYEEEAFLTSNSELIPSSTAYQYIHYLGDNSIKHSITGCTTENFLEK